MSHKPAAMPNWGGVNQRAVSAKQAKEAARKDKLIQEQKKKEDLLWKDSVTDAKLSKKVDFFKLSGCVSVCKESIA